MAKRSLPPDPILVKLTKREIRCLRWSANLGLLYADGDFSEKVRECVISALEKILRAYGDDPAVEDGMVMGYLCGVRKSDRQKRNEPSPVGTPQGPTAFACIPVVTADQLAAQAEKVWSHESN